jgi:alpha-1,3-rhamnosyl/mannosyltransferase
MNILIDGRMISNTGIGRLLHNLVTHLLTVATGHHITVLVSKPGAGIRRFPEGTRCVRVGTPIYSIQEQLFLPSRLRALAPDLVHFPNFNVPLAGPRPYVLTLCDLIYYKWPHACPSPLAHAYVRWLMPRAARGAHTILTISQYSRGEIVERLGIDENRVRVVYPAADLTLFHPRQDPDRIAAIRTRYGIRTPYVFYTGNHEPRKGLADLLRAFRALPMRRDVQLLIGGPIDPRRAALYREAADLVTEGSVIFSGQLAEADLPAVYAGASVFVFPSHYEGFGLPPLEAMACGLPVVCSSATSLPEVVGDAAILVPPGSVEGLSHAIEAVLTDEALRRALCAKGLQRARQFSWALGAEEVLQVYREAVEGGSIH